MSKNKTLEKYTKLMGSGWARVLLPFLESQQMKDIAVAIKADVDAGNQVYPMFDDIFRPFYECPWENLHTVFLAVNPYFKGQSDGLLFSCRPKSTKRESVTDFPAVLNKIQDAIEEDYADGLFLNRKSDLSAWGTQGVLLLPIDLTTIKDKPTAHINLWKPFIEYVLVTISTYNTGVVHVMFGPHAKSLDKFVKKETHSCEYLEHPMSAVKEKRMWEHKNIFTRLNNIVKFLNNTTVNWTK